jgi:hypothetical protein
MPDQLNRNRFPGFDVLDQRAHWDQLTRDLVLGRLTVGGDLCFFTEREEPVCRALLDRLLACSGEQESAWVFEMIDRRLADGTTDGWRYDDLPPDAEAWRRSLAELAQTPFMGLDPKAQTGLLESIRTSEKFAGMPASRLWGLWMRYACTAYYSHPSAWNEIGFGGPAYPRGYKSIGLDRREPWEVKEAATQSRGHKTSKPRERELKRSRAQ